MTHFDQFGECDPNTGFGGQGVGHRSGNGNNIKNALHDTVLINAGCFGFK